MRLCGCVGTTKAFPESGTIEGVRGSTRNREMRPESEREGGGGGRGKERGKGGANRERKMEERVASWRNAGLRLGGEFSVHRASSCIPKCVRHCFNSTHA